MVRRRDPMQAFGHDASIAGRPVITNRGTMTIGRRLGLRSSPVPTHIEVVKGAELRIGNDVCIAHGVSIQAYVRVEIGDGVAIGPFAIIMDTDHHRAGNRDAIPAREPIRIGRGARIGAHATVLRGADIGAGAWVEPGSVVLGFVAPGAHVSGNPAVRRGDAPQIVCTEPPSTRIAVPFT